MDGLIDYNGQKFLPLDDDGRYSCTNSYVEEVDYSWFSSTNGKTILIPCDSDGVPYAEPPVCMCFIDEEGNRTEKAHGCWGRDRCKFYDKVEFD